MYIIKGCPAVFQILQELHILVLHTLQFLFILLQASGQRLRTATKEKIEKRTAPSIKSDNVVLFLTWKLLVSVYLSHLGPNRLAECLLQIWTHVIYYIHGIQLQYNLAVTSSDRTITCLRVPLHTYDEGTLFPVKCARARRPPVHSDHILKVPWAIA